MEGAGAEDDFFLPPAGGGVFFSPGGERVPHVVVFSIFFFGLRFYCSPCLYWLLLYYRSL